MNSTSHRLVNGDARDLSFMEDESVHLVVTSPPYWNLKRYNENPDQLGHIEEYETFIKELEKVWKHQEGRAENIPFNDSSFDYVSCCDVLEHVDDINKTVSEISRVLKPGGLFFYDTINRTFASWLVMIKIAQDWKRSAWEAPNTHEWRRFVKPSELRAILEKNGLAMHEIQGIGSGSRRSVIRKAIRERAKGKITCYEMGLSFGFERNDETDISYMGFAIKQWGGRDLMYHAQQRTLRRG